MVELKIKKRAKSKIKRYGCTSKTKVACLHQHFTQSNIKILNVLVTIFSILQALNDLKPKSKLSLGIIGEVKKSSIKLQRYYTIEQLNSSQFNQLFIFSLVQQLASMLAELGPAQLKLVFIAIIQKALINIVFLQSIC